MREEIENNPERTKKREIKFKKVKARHQEIFRRHAAQERRLGTVRDKQNSDRFDYKSQLLELHREIYSESEEDTDQEKEDMKTAQGRRRRRKRLRKKMPKFPKNTDPERAERIKMKRKLRKERRAKGRDSDSEDQEEVKWDPDQDDLDTESEEESKVVQENVPQVLKRPVRTVGPLIR